MIYEMEKFDRITIELAEIVEFGGDLEVACAQCPYHEQCHQEEMFWGCGAWEQSMGEDL